MKAARTFRILLSFYRSFFLLNSIITLLCLLLFREYGWNIFSNLLLLKTAVLGLSCYFIGVYRKNEFIYYQNLGFSKLLLWCPTLSFDLLLYLLLITQMPKVW